MKVITLVHATGRLVSHGRLAQYDESYRFVNFKEFKFLFSVF